VNDFDSVECQRNRFIVEVSKVEFFFLFLAFLIQIQLTAWCIDRHGFAQASYFELFY